MGENYGIINIDQAKTQLSQLLLRVHSGEGIIISKAGKPYAKLIPLQQPIIRTPGIAKGRVTDAFFDTLPEEELGQWE
jgi:prevent-host-death family protein